MQQFQYAQFKKKQESVLDFLCRRFPYQTRDQWQSAVERGALKVDGCLTGGDTILKTGQMISYQRRQEDEPPVDREYKILFEDLDLIVVEKSGNIPIVESGKYYKNTLLEVLKEEEGYSCLHQVHRLDRETSGVLVIARSPKVATHLGGQFASGEIKKRYQAVIQGVLEEEVFVDQPIKKIKPSSPDVVRIRQVIDPAGKPSQTKFIPKQIRGALTWVEVELFTGRTHQIRVHAEHMGFPILGDKLYGQSDQRFIALLKGEVKPEFEGFGLIDRQLLHASQLEFLHPSSGEQMRFVSSCESFFSKYPCTQALFETSRD